VHFVHDVRAPRVVFAPGALARVAEEVVGLGVTRALVITSASAAEYTDRVSADLGDRVVARIHGVVMHVPAEVARAAVEAARESGADGVVCVGGGSATGLAKAVALETGLPIVAVPTTYSGSEVTPVWGRTADGRKTTGRDPRVLPRVVVYDPDLTASLPPATAAASALNAVAHCVEAMYAPDASPVTALLAEEGIRAIARALPGFDHSGLLYGAWLAGWTLGGSTMGVHHRICHVLGGSYDLPHAQTHAVILPYAAAYNAGHAPDALARVARALGVSDPAGGLWDLARSAGVPAALTDLGFVPEKADDAADLVAASPPANPKPVERAWVRALLLDACAGRRPTQR
jgi:maleylacetate reductase